MNPTAPHRAPAHGIPFDGVMVIACQQAGPSSQEQAGMRFKTLERASPPGVSSVNLT